jgi:hypothetical protein
MLNDELKKLSLVHHSAFIIHHFFKVTAQTGKKFLFEPFLGKNAR